MGTPDDHDSIRLLLRRIRAGDPDAATELVRRFEPLIRLRVRVWLRLHHPGLMGEFDSADICQSVLQSFFVRAAGGQFDLDDPDKVAGLLVRMARYKLLDQVKHRHAGPRDIRRRERAGVGAPEPVAREADPARLVMGRDLLEMVRSRLNDEERRVANFRAEGRTWAEIASGMGGTPDGRRKQLTRALDRVAVELDIDRCDLGG